MIFNCFFMFLFTIITLAKEKNSTLFSNKTLEIKEGKDYLIMDYHVMNIRSVLEGHLAS